MDETVLVIVAVVATLVVVAIAWLFLSRRRTGKLREEFGPEYDREVRKSGGRRDAERELEMRRERMEKLHIRPLESRERERYQERWQDVQGHFVDNPTGAVNEAQDLVEEVMNARGYPVGDLKQQEADVSVENPDVVRHFRQAHAIARKNENGGASTEELRQAMRHYRELFQGLLEGGRPEKLKHQAKG